MRRVVLFKWSTRIVWKMFEHNPEKKVQVQGKWAFVERKFLEGGTNNKVMR